MMTTTPTNSRSKSPPHRLWKALNQMNPQKMALPNRKKIRTRKQVSFSDQLVVVPTAVCLSEAEEDTLWWTDDELEVITTTARALGDLDAYREGLIKAQYIRQDVLEEQDRLRQLGQLGSDWNPIARVSRKGSMDSSRKARKNGIEFENCVNGDNNKLAAPQSSANCGSRCVDLTRLFRSRIFKVRPTPDVFESSRRFDSELQ